MKLDGRRFDGATLSADLCIVGAGAAGLTLAHALRNTGLDILMVETGVEGFSAEHQTQNAGEVQKDSRHPSALLYRQRRLGGSTAIWGGRCVPYEPIDFEARPGLRAGWPIPYAEVAAHYPEAMAYLEAGAADFDAYTALVPGAALVEGFKDEEVSGRSIERFSLPTHFGKRWAKELATFPNVRLLLATTVTSLELSQDFHRIDALHCAACDRRFQIHATTVVVAAGGLETYRLLASAGLDRPMPTLGTGYMCHIEGTVGELVLAPATRKVSHGFDRTIDGAYARQRFTLTEPTMRRAGLLNFMARLHHEDVVDPAHRNGVLSAMYLAKSFIIPEYRRKLSALEHVAVANKASGLQFWASHLGNVVRDAPRLATFTADWTVRRYMVKRRLPYVALKSRRGVYPLDFNAEQIPAPESRVRLSDKTDAFGTPQLRIEWRMSETDVASAAGSLRILRDGVARSGVGQVRFESDDIEALIRDKATPIGGHHIGTARMSESARDGVVDADLHLHSTINLYVCGASAFPTSSHANPTLTIVALALRLADHLKAKLSKSLAV